MFIKYKNAPWERITTLHAFSFLAFMLFSNLWQSFVWQEGFSRLELGAYLLVVALGLMVIGRQIYPTIPSSVRKKIGLINQKFGLFPILLIQLMAAYFLNALATPSQASILLGNVRTKVADILDQMAGVTEGAEGMTSLVTFVFAAFELIILGYIVYSAVQVFSKRDDERWLDLLRTPALVLGSILAFNFIVGLL